MANESIDGIVNSYIKIKRDRVDFFDSIRQEELSVI